MTNYGQDPSGYGQGSGYPQGDGYGSGYGQTDPSGQYAPSPYSQQSGSGYPPAAQPGYQTPPQPGYQPAPQPGYQAAPQPGYQTPQPYPSEYANYPEPSGDSASLGQSYYSSYNAAVPAVQTLPPYGYAPVLQPHPSSTSAMVLGIMSIAVLPIFGPFAWYLGAKGRREMNQQPGRWAPSGGLTAGLVMGMITTIVMSAVVFMMFIMILAAAVGA